MIGTVLAIDDTEIDQMCAGRVLRRSGLVRDVEFAASGLEALSKLRHAKSRPDLVLLDINMPLMNGFEFLDAAVQEFGAGFAHAVYLMLTIPLDRTARECAEAFSVVSGTVTKPLLSEDVDRIDVSMRSTCVASASGRSAFGDQNRLGQRA